MEVGRALLLVIFGTIFKAMVGIIGFSFELFQDGYDAWMLDFALSCNQVEALMHACQCASLFNPILPTNRLTYDAGRDKQPGTPTAKGLE
jgi:hypothetical protein